MPDRILVAGATGGTGQLIVAKLRSLDHPVRAFVLDLAEALELLPPEIELVQGNAVDPAALPPAVHDVRAVICAIGSRVPLGDNRPERVDYEGVRNLVHAACDAGVTRFVLISSIHVTHPENPFNRFGQILDWKLKGEDALRDSGLIYTIIRPGGLTDDPGGSPIQIGQRDTLKGKISRSDVAAVTVSALDDSRTYYTTFEIINAVDPYLPDDWQAHFAALKTDRDLHGRL